MALSGREVRPDLSTYADEVLKEQLQRINEVGAIRMGGLRLRQVRIWLDRYKLEAYKLTAHAIRTLQRETSCRGRIEHHQGIFGQNREGSHPQEFNDLIVDITATQR
jgi:multidrug efflux pump subunit AcrB